ncbi:MAG TPA: hypothetical protein VF629_04700 [Hymenobacter sp.]|jgi:hypothetical protein|uniref:hypothetical protein n=1 Tax=Hymenobacter sp. TaxID=1898978 RepID=UPI002ED808B5
MTAAQEKARASLPSTVKYFERIAQDTKWHMWEAEYEVASATVNLIFAKEKYTEADLKEVALCVNRIVNREHSDGSGWLDFQCRISGFFSSFGYNSNWNSSTGEFTFWKDEFRFWKRLVRI